MTALTKIDAEEFSQTLEQIGEGWFRQLALGLRLGVPEALGLGRREWSDRLGVTVRGAAERRGGDYDPSGVLIDRDIEKRLRKHLDARGIDPDHLTFHRIAITDDQVGGGDPNLDAS